mgnify:FL=1
METTRREEMIELIKKDSWTLLSLARFFSVPLKTIGNDIEHIEKSLSKDFKIKVSAAICESCEFIFKKDKLKKPSRCPKCKSEYIGEPSIQLIEK